MAQLPLTLGIPRFRENEERIDIFTNGGTDFHDGFYTSTGVFVPSMRNAIRRMETAFDALKPGFDATINTGIAALFGGITAVATTLASGQPATASFDPATKVLSIGVPRGAQGAPGSGGGGGTGNMLSSTYDPEGVGDDAFDRSNHHGTQAISTIAGLQGALNARPTQAGAPENRVLELISEFATGQVGAQFDFSGWRPYDADEVGDSATGLLFEGGVSPNISSIVTPVFDGGWDYLFLLDRVRASGTSSTTDYLRIESESSGWSDTAQSGFSRQTPSALNTGYVMLPSPYAIKRQQFIFAALTKETHANNMMNPMDYSSRVHSLNTAQRRTRLQLSTTNTWNTGKFYLLRRRSYGSWM